MPTGRPSTPPASRRKNNKDDADWSDVEAAIEALHSDTTDALAWRTRLEASLDVDAFLRWLAVNTAIQNWDSYGTMAHNYYLYADPAKARQLRWITWDHNLSMMPGMLGGGDTLDVSAEMFHANAGAQWPLISRVLADTSYRARYRELLAEALGGQFEVEAATARARTLHELITPHVVGDGGEQPGYTTISSPTAFAEAVDGSTGLAAHIAKRHARVTEALAVP